MALDGVERSGRVTKKGGWSPRRPQAAPAPGRVGLVTDNGAGQDGGWRATGTGGHRGASAETWEGLAEACFELSVDRVGAAHRVPRVGRQGPAVPPHRDRAHASWASRRRSGTARSGDHVKNDFAAMQRALDRRAPAARPGAAVRAEFVEVTTTRLGQLGERDRGRVGRRRLEPGGRGAPRGVHGGARLRQLGARAGRPPRPRPPGRQREPWRRPSRWTGCRAPCPSSSARRPAAPTAPPCASTSRVPATTPAPSPSPSRAGGPGRWATTWRRRSPCRCRASTSCGSAAAGPRRNRWRPPAGSAMEGDAAVGQPVLGAMNFMF